MFKNNLSASCQQDEVRMGRTHTIQKLMKKEVLENGNLKRKERSDKGLTLFNSEKKWQSTITPYSVFNKAKRIENMVRG